MRILSIRLTRQCLDLRLTKARLSRKLNVSDITIYLLERNNVSPSLAQFPKIIEFLGQDPYEKEAATLGEKIREFRRVHELSLKKLAAQIGVDPGTLAGWEKKKYQPKNELTLYLEDDS